MIALVLAWLLNPKNWVMVGVSLVLAYAGVTTVRLNHAKWDLTQARKQLAETQVALDTQNEAVKKLNKATVEKQQAYAHAQEGLKASAAQAQAQVTRLLAAKATGDRCVAARRLIVETVK